MNVCYPTKYLKHPIVLVLFIAPEYFNRLPVNKCLGLMDHMAVFSRELLW